MAALILITVMKKKREKRIPQYCVAFGGVGESQSIRAELSQSASLLLPRTLLFNDGQETLKVDVNPRHLRRPICVAKGKRIESRLELAKKKKKKKKKGMSIIHPMNPSFNRKIHHLSKIIQ